MTFNMKAKPLSALVTAVSLEPKKVDITSYGRGNKPPTPVETLQLLAKGEGTFGGSEREGKAGVWITEKGLVDIVGWC